MFHHGGLALKDNELCYTDDVYLYDLKSNAWTFLSKEEPYRASKQHSIGLRADHTAIPLNSELVLVFGGRSPKTSSEFSSLTQYYVFDICKQEWVEKSELAKYSNIPKKLGSLYIGDSGEYGIYHGIEKSQVDRTVLRMANRPTATRDPRNSPLVHSLYKLYKDGKCTDFTITGVDCSGLSIVSEIEDFQSVDLKGLDLNGDTHDKEDAAMGLTTRGSTTRSSTTMSSMTNSFANSSSTSLSTSPECEKVFLNAVATTNNAHTTSHPNTCTLRAHTPVLYSRWKYFASLYDSGMQESSTRTLHIEEPFPWIKALVHYLYTDSIEELDLETVAGVMILAHIYDLPELGDICTSQICNSAAYTSHQKVLFWYRGYVAENTLVQQKFARLCFESRDKITKEQAFQDLERVGLLSTLCSDMFSLQ